MMQKPPAAKPWIVMVGGFLGAGKTTLLLAAAGELEARGIRSALILNDQGEALVDSSYAALHGLKSGEVTGGCFCCKFSDLIRVMDQLKSHAPEVIFAEPVGSCTDIYATTLLPLREYADQYRLAPFTVLVDPARANELLSNSADPHLRFLFQKQIEEADIVCFTKSDLKLNPPPIEAQAVRQLSAKTGQGVSAWIDEVLSGVLSCAAKTLTIDYAEYARAEAALAWLNLEATIALEDPLSGAMILGPLLDRLENGFTKADIAIVHLKAIIQSSQGYLKAAICANSQQPSIEGDLAASTAVHHHLLLNLRAVGSAATVKAIVEKKVRQIGGSHLALKIACFHPSAPKPERRVPA